MSTAVRPHYTALDLPAIPPDRPYVLVNMVMSIDGKVVVDGTEQGLGSKTDQELMRELRVNADIVMNGAGTLRASGTSPRIGRPDLVRLRTEAGKPANPIGAVISASGDLPLDRIFFTAGDFRAVVYLAATVPEERREAVQATGRLVHVLPPEDPIRAMLRHMRQDLGAQVLLLEGGPTLNAELLGVGAVDEFFVTIGPVIVGGRDTLTAVEGERARSRDELARASLLSAVHNPETGEVYLRYRL
ncbi:MAG: deaminase [Dehalococcoidia bacterium]|nr:deaminase [Dehalococcoidia bacterium]